MATLLGMTEGADIEFEAPRAEIHSPAAEFDRDEPGEEAFTARALHFRAAAADSAGAAGTRAPSRQDCWLADNKDALQSSNDHVNRQGLPLARIPNAATLAAIADAKADKLTNVDLDEL